MRLLSKDQDFSLRVHNDSNDEVGHLTRGFNDMLSHLQAREVMLDERNRQLAQSNQELELAVVQAPRPGTWRNKPPTSNPCFWPI